MSTLAYRPVELSTAHSEASEVHAGDTQITQRPRVAASSGSQLMAVHAGAGNIEDADDDNHQVISSLESALHDDDDATVKVASDDGHSYAGTIVRGGLRGDSE